MEFASCLQVIKRNMQKAVVGKDAVIDRLLIALICSGHVLVEDLPGLGKTTAVSALAASLGCSFQCIQFTPDVLPSDITGFNVVRLQSGDTVFHPGSVHNQIVLADEINRASPKTQAALRCPLRTGDTLTACLERAEPVLGAAQTDRLRLALRPVMALHYGDHLPTAEQADAIAAAHAMLEKVVWQRLGWLRFFVRRRVLLRRHFRAVRRIRSK